MDKQLEILEGGTSCEKLPVKKNQEGKIKPNIEPGASKRKQRDIRSFLQGVNAERSPNNEVKSPVLSPVVEEQEENICKIKRGQCLEHKK